MNRNIIKHGLLFFDLGSLLNAGMSISDSLFGTDFSGQKASRKAAQQMAREEMKFNADQAVLNRNFQRDERQAAQEYQSDEWNRQFDIMSAYNSPSAQVQRMIDAGLNPNALYEGCGCRFCFSVRCFFVRFLWFCGFLLFRFAWFFVGF